MNHTWPDRMSGGEVFAYVRHKPEQTLLYQLIERHWPEFQSHLNEVGEHKEMTWAQRLKRVFNIDITICNR